MAAGRVDLAKYQTIMAKSFIKRLGRVTHVVGLTIESSGPDVRIGDVCDIRSSKYSKPIKSQVVGFKGSNILLMPLGDMSGIGPGSTVEALNKPLTIKISDNILGRVINGIGEPMDGKPPLVSGEDFPLTNPPPNPLHRKRITKPLAVGVKAIDGLLTIGMGQRIGIFAGSGVGKSTLLGMIARNTNADINVIGLVGERGREVREFIEKDLGEEGLRRSVVVIATSDQTALVRSKCCETATAVAEYFRSKGKNVMLMMDSLTRYAMAQREIGLAVGEPPVSRGYTPSMFAEMPRLLERAGNSDVGSITGLYTVLVDGDDLTELVTDTARGILDGHIVLNRKIASRNHYPAIDVLASVSRVMPDVVTDEHLQDAGEIKRLMSIYTDSEDLISIGAYVPGSSPEIDMSIDKHKSIDGFLRQPVKSNFSIEETLQTMKDIVGDIEE